MIADGSISESEKAQLANMMSFSPIYAHHDAKQIVGCINEVLESLKGDPAQVLTGSAERLSPALRETALCFAIRIALADGHVDDGERTALIATAASMQIEPSSFGAIFEVMSMLQRRADA
ncbi:MAG: tellurite resistance TerB family protein [Pseudomonadota bacterium]